MLPKKTSKIICAGFFLAAAARGIAQDFELSWYTVDGGGAMFTSGGSFEMSGTIGQPDAGVLTGGSLELTGGFWGVAAPSGTGVPAATLTAGVSRKTNPAGTGGVCDVALIPVRSEPRQGGVTELRMTFDIAPGSPGANPVTIEEATCAAPSYGPSDSSISSATVVGNNLALTFAPALKNGRTYKLTVGPAVTSVAGQFIEVRGLLGDVNSDGHANATDRSVVVGAWTGIGFTCPSDVNSDGDTNATDRSIVVGAWTGTQNCAP